MPFGQSITSYVANLFPTDPLAPQVNSDFASTYPTGTVEGFTKGDAVSSYAQNIIPTDPLHPTDIGQQLSIFIALQGPDLGDGGLFG